jgi:hypothetical protein
MKTKQQKSDETRLAISVMKVEEERKMTLPCKYCGKPRQSTLAKMCNACKEFKNLIEVNLVGTELLFLEALMSHPDQRHGPLGHFLLTLPPKIKSTKGS